MAFNGDGFAGAGPPGGYAGSQASSPPPGMRNGAVPPSPNYQVNNNYQNQVPMNNGGSSCNCTGNPFERANYLTNDKEYNLRYKQAMGVGLVQAAVSMVSLIVIFASKCIFLNFFGIFHVFPVLMVNCGRAIKPITWSYLSIGSVFLSLGTLFLGLIQGCEEEGAIVAALMIIMEALMVWVLHKMDPELISRIKFCFAQCGCLGRNAQLQTMAPQDTNYPTSSPTVNNMGQPQFSSQPYNQGGGAQGFSSSPPASPGSQASYPPQAPGSQVSYNPPPPNHTGGFAPQPPGSHSGYNQGTGTRSDAGGHVFMDAPNEFDASSRPGY